MTTETPIAGPETALETIRTDSPNTSTGCQQASANGLNIDPYDRIRVEGEPERVFRAFKEYIRMGTNRSLPKLTESLIKNPDWTDSYESVLRMVKGYSSKFEWQQRLRTLITATSAEVLAAAQKDALLHAKQRISFARDAQNFGITIMEKAELDKLTVAEARKLLKDGAKLLQLGLTGERAEIGDNLAVIKPDKPIREMDDEELEAYTSILLNTI